MKILKLAKIAGSSPVWVDIFFFCFRLQAIFPFAFTLGAGNWTFFGLRNYVGEPIATLAKRVFCNYTLVKSQLWSANFGYVVIVVRSKY